MPDVVIEPMRPNEIMEAAAVVGRAFASLPANEAMPAKRAASKEARMTALFRAIFGHLPGQTLVARQDQRIVGAIRIVKWPQCQVSALMMVPFVIGIERCESWRWLITRCVWVRHDPWRHHLHIAPLGVEPDLHGGGIGSQLLRRFCDLAEEASLPGYLETDRQENVRLYQRFGFLTSAKASILGRTTWFMWRPIPSTRTDPV